MGEKYSSVGENNWGENGQNAVQWVEEKNGEKMHKNSAMGKKSQLCGGETVHLGKKNHNWGKITDKNSAVEKLMDKNKLQRQDIRQIHIATEDNTLQWK